MKGFQQVTLIGNLGAKPELKHLPDGTTTVCNVSLAVNENFTAKDGAKVERVEWFRLAFWNKAAEVLCQYAHKGDGLFVQGQLRSHTYTDENGIEKNAFEIRVSNWQFIGGKAKDTNGETANDNTTPLPGDKDLPF